LRPTTVEVRILPGALDGASIVKRAALVERLVRRCLDDEPLPRPDRGALADPAGSLLALATKGARR
jgi:hypothetical protein